MDAFAAYAEHPHLQAAGTADQRCIHCGSGNGLSRALRCINLFDFGLHLINTVAFRDMSSPQLDLRIRVRRRRRTRRGTAVHALPSSCSATMESRAEKCVIHRTNANYTFTYNRSWRHIVSFRSEVNSSLPSAIYHDFDSLQIFFALSFRLHLFNIFGLSADAFPFL